MEIRKSNECGPLYSAIAALESAVGQYNIIYINDASYIRRLYQRYKNYVTLQLPTKGESVTMAQ